MNTTTRKTIDRSALKSIFGKLADELGMRKTSKLSDEEKAKRAAAKQAKRDAARTTKRNAAIKVLETGVHTSSKGKQHKQSATAMLRWAFTAIRNGLPLLPASYRESQDWSKVREQLVAAAGAYHLDAVNVVQAFGLGPVVPVASAPKSGGKIVKVIGKGKRAA